MRIRNTVVGNASVRSYMLTYRDAIHKPVRHPSSANKYTSLEEVSEALRNAGLESSNLIVGRLKIKIVRLIYSVERLTPPVRGRGGLHCQQRYAGNPLVWREKLACARSFATQPLPEGNTRRVCYVLF